MSQWIVTILGGRRREGVGADLVQEYRWEEGYLVRAIILQMVQNFQRVSFSIPSRDEVFAYCRNRPTCSRSQRIVFALHREQIGAIELFIIGPIAPFLSLVISLAPQEITSHGSCRPISRGKFDRHRLSIDNEGGGVCADGRSTELTAKSQRVGPRACLSRISFTSVWMREKGFVLRLSSKGSFISYAQRAG
jgi:hypothetical protein